MHPNPSVSMFLVVNLGLALMMFFLRSEHAESAAAARNRALRTGALKPEHLNWMIRKRLPRNIPESVRLELRNATIDRLGLGGTRGWMKSVVPTLQPLGLVWVRWITEGHDPHLLTDVLRAKIGADELSAHLDGTALLDVEAVRLLAALASPPTADQR